MNSCTHALELFFIAKGATVKNLLNIKLLFFSIVHHPLASLSSFSTAFAQGSLETKVPKLNHIFQPPLEKCALNLKLK